MRIHLPVPVSCLAVLACAAAPPKLAVMAPEAPPPPRVEKMREPLEVTPLELHFSGLRGATKDTETVTVKNTANEPVQVSELRVVGLAVATFKLVNTPMFPVVLPPAGTFTYTVAFEPPADAELGVHSARVRLVRTQDDDGPPCDLTGLVTQSRTDEPPLAQILDALGYEVNVGATSLTLPAQAAGDGVDVPTFQRAKTGNVGYYLIARYSAEESSQFGYYIMEKGKPVPRQIGAAGRAQSHTLNPELEGDSQGSFEPGDAPFGLYLKAGARLLYADAGLNGAGPKAVARVYPLHSRGRAPVPDAYVVAFDADKDGDFQDYVFMLWNVKPSQ